MRFHISFLLATVVSWTTEATLQDFKKGNNLFTAAIYKEISNTDKGNILVSPLSTEIIFALTQSGAKGATASEIRNTLHLPDTDEEVRLTIKTLLPTLKGDKAFILHTANKIYVKQGFPIKREFQQIANEAYKASFENINFSDNVQAANNINKWVKERTQNKIQNLIDPSSLDSQTAAILISALYFNGKWDNSFSPSLTKKKDFYRPGQGIIQVETMHDYNQESEYFDSKELRATFLKLPFLGDNVAMIIVLPDEKDGITRLQTQIEKVFSQNKTWEVDSFNVTIPKFKIESSLGLEEIMTNLGVKKAFLPNEADFSGITDAEKLYINKALQKTFIDVDEKGVEAAAISYIGWHYLSGPPDARRQFIADHPFIFYIEINNLIVFAGRVTDPASKI